MYKNWKARVVETGSFIYILHLDLPIKRDMTMHQLFDVVWWDHVPISIGQPISWAILKVSFFFFLENFEEAT